LPVLESELREITSGPVAIAWGVRSRLIVVALFLFGLLVAYNAAGVPETDPGRSSG